MEALRQRYLDRLLAQPDRRHPPARRSAPVHHHQHHGLVRRLRRLHRARCARHRRVGRLRRRRALRLGGQRGAARPHPRLQAAQLLGDGNPAGLRQLARDQRGAAQGPGAGDGLAGGGARRRCGLLLAVARGAERAGGIPRHPGRRRWRAGAGVCGDPAGRRGVRQGRRGAGGDHAARGGGADQRLRQPLGAGFPEALGRLRPGRADEVVLPAATAAGAGGRCGLGAGAAGRLQAGGRAVAQCAQRGADAAAEGLCRTRRASGAGPAQRDEERRQRLAAAAPARPAGRTAGRPRAAVLCAGQADPGRRCGRRGQRKDLGRAVAGARGADRGAVALRPGQRLAGRCAGGADPAGRQGPHQLCRRLAGRCHA